MILSGEPAIIALKDHKDWYEDEDPGDLLRARVRLTSATMTAAPIAQTPSALTLAPHKLTRSLSDMTQLSLRRVFKSCSFGDLDIWPKLRTLGKGVFSGKLCCSPRSKSTLMEIGIAFVQFSFATLQFPTCISANLPVHPGVHAWMLLASRMAG
jgi:hypothetical protein